MWTADRTRREGQSAAGASFSVSAGAGNAYGMVAYSTAPDVMNAGKITVTGPGTAFGFDESQIDPLGGTGSPFTNAATGTITVTSSGGTAIGVAFLNATAVVNQGAISVSGVGSATGIIQDGFQFGSIENDGSITVTASGPGAGACGIDVSGNSNNLPPGSNVINTGTIIAQTALRISYGGSSQVVVGLVNSGIIQGDINLGASVARVVNTGQITGNILLFYANDLIDLRGGSFTGSIVIDPVDKSGLTTADTVYQDPVSDTVYTGSGASLVKIVGGDLNLNVAVTGSAGGQTTVQYDETLAQAKFTHNADGSWTVAAGSDGTETLTNVQSLAFTDKTISLAQPLSAGASLTAAATNGAAAAIAYGAVSGAVTDIIATALSVTGAAMAAGSSSAGTVSLNGTNQTVVFTPAAGFAGTAVVNVTVTDGDGLSVVQPVDVNVVVQASAPVVTPTNTTSTTVNGNVTTIQTFSPTGTLISTETITVNGTKTQTEDFNAAGTQTAATITQVNGAFTQVQNFDGNWNQLNASITDTEGGGNSVVQNFDGSWNQTGAVVTTVNGSKTQVQTFNPSWVQLSATITTVNGAVTQTQNFDGNWNQTSANLTYALAGGGVKSQNFDGDWQQTSASITSHPAANQTQVQIFNASWQQTSATVATVANGQTTTQSFNGSWVFQGATIDTPNPDAALSDRLDTYGANWNPLTEVDTFLNGGQSYFTYGTSGGGQSFTAAAGHSTTFIFTPGEIAGDAIAGLHTLNLGGAIHDVIDFEGYGAGAHLLQVDATHWQVVSTNNATESFTLTGGATLAAGDYAFVASGSNLTSASVGGAASTPSAALFSQFAASGLGAAADDVDDPAHRRTAADMSRA